MRGPDDRRIRSEARSQHHVPQLLLKAFARVGKGKKHQVQVFDKHTDRSFQASTEKVFAERDFNTFERDGAVLCLEDEMAAIENLAAPVICKLVEARALAVLTVTDREILNGFVALQKVRGVGLREQMADMTTAIKKRIQRAGSDPETIPQFKGSNEPDAVKLSALSFVRDHVQEFAQHIAEKNLVLFGSPKADEFLLGDSPVTWHNHRDMGPYGNLGLLVPGIELYLPLAPTLMLSLWCPSIIPRWREEQKDLTRAAGQAAAISVIGIGKAAEEARIRHTELERKAANLQQKLSLIDQGLPLTSTSENMMWFNSLQIGQAERYLVSASGNFDLARRMITDNARYRKGHRVELS